MFNEVKDLFEIPDGMKYVLYNYNDSVRLGELMIFEESYEDYWIDVWSHNPESIKFDRHISLKNITNVTFLKVRLTKEQAKDQYPEYFI
jgi:hypothetical protein